MTLRLLPPNDPNALGPTLRRRARFNPTAPSPLPFSKVEVPIPVLRKRLAATREGREALLAVAHAAAHVRGDPTTRRLLAEAVRGERRGYCGTIAAMQLAAVQNAALRLFVVSV